MAEESVPFDTGPGSIVDEAGWRRMARGFAGDGLILPITAEGQISAGGGASVTRGACPVGFIVDGFHYRDTASSNRPVTVNSSSNPRRDRAVLRLDPTLNKVSWEVKLGTPGLNPVAPALTVDRAGIYEIPLASWTMPGSASTQAPTAFTDERISPNARPRGQVDYDQRGANDTTGTIGQRMTNPKCELLVVDGPRRVRVTAWGICYTLTGAPHALFTLYRDGPGTDGYMPGGDCPIPLAGANSVAWRSTAVETAQPGLNTYSVDFRAVSAGTVVSVGSAVQPTCMLVEDLGPA